MEKRVLSSGQTIIMHEEGTCRGSCPVHRPSNHHMRDFKLSWRDDRGIFERICPHGIGHPDPDTLLYVESTRGAKAAKAEGVHGCDGCCLPGNTGWRPTDTV